MKAKFIGIASMLALLAACDQDKYELDNLVPEEYNKILYIKEYGTPEITLYNADEKSTILFSVNLREVRTLWRSRCLRASVR